MSLKRALQKWYKAIRAGYIGVCLIGTAVAIGMGYHFFHDRMLVFSVFTAYILFMASIVIFLGLYLIKRLTPSHTLAG